MLVTVLARIVIQIRVVIVVHRAQPLHKGIHGKIQPVHTVALDAAAVVTCIKLLVLVVICFLGGEAGRDLRVATHLLDTVFSDNYRILVNVKVQIPAPVSCQPPQSVSTEHRIFVAVFQLVSIF